MNKCGWMEDDLCTNPDCPAFQGYCPVRNMPGVCRYESADTPGLILVCKSFRGEELPMKRKRFVKLMMAQGYTRNEANHAADINRSQTDLTEWLGRMERILIRRAERENRR